MTKLSPKPIADATLPLQCDTTSSGTAKLQAANAPENAVQPVAIPTSQHDDFAKQLGFESYLALFEASTPIASAQPGQWLLTSLQGKKWISWNAADLTRAGTFDTEAEAISSLPPQTGS